MVGTRLSGKVKSEATRVFRNEAGSHRAQSTEGKDICHIDNHTRLGLERRRTARAPPPLCHGRPPGAGRGPSTFRRESGFLSGPGTPVGPPLLGPRSPEAHSGGQKVPRGGLGARGNPRRGKAKG